MAPSVTMKNWLFIGWKLCNRVPEHNICQFSIWWGPNCPGNWHTIKAVYYMRKIYFAGFDRELCDICKPFLIGAICMEVSIHKIFYSWCYFSLVRLYLRLRFVFTQRHSSFIMRLTTFSETIFPSLQSSKYILRYPYTSLVLMEHFNNVFSEI